MKRVAHVLLPAGSFAETSGTYVNLEGRWQSQARRAGASGCIAPGVEDPARARQSAGPAGIRLPVLRAVRDELQGAHLRPRRRPRRRERRPPGPAAQTEPVIDLAMYQIDPVLRRAGVAAAHADGRAAPARCTRGRGQVSSPGSHLVPLPAYVHSTVVTRAADRGADPVGGVSDVVGAQAHRLDADAHRPEPREDLRLRCLAWASRSPTSSSC